MTAFRRHEVEVKAIDPSTRQRPPKAKTRRPVAELEVASVALSSAVSEIHNPYPAR